MNTQPNPQLAPAMALVQLLTDHPDLTVVRWSVDPGTLRGYVCGPLDGNWKALHACADLFGATARPRKGTYEALGIRLRTYEITTIWRDVPVEIAVSIPADLHDPALMEGLLDEQRHQLIDPAVPAEPKAVAA
ncbi:hypothetical protein ABZ442_05185 [Streptomyces triculaminicus]|uniref:hypothetical protein n=1 Tax=Streptomyces triculaminicus TaxID=2816232 RepID=UPI0033C8C62E